MFGILLQTGGGVELIVALAFVIVVIAGVWKTFTKANQPGWAAIVPIYNLYIMLKIGDNEWWWLLVLLVPILNLVALFKIFTGVAKALIVRERPQRTCVAPQGPPKT